MITLNLFDSNWWYSFREINVFKKCKQTLILSKITKKWANLVSLIYFLFFSRDFKIWENILSQIFLLKFGGLMLFPKNCLFQMQKNSNATFFLSGRKNF